MRHCGSPSYRLAFIRFHLYRAISWLAERKSQALRRIIHARGGCESPGCPAAHSWQQRRQCAFTEQHSNGQRPYQRQKTISVDALSGEDAWCDGRCARALASHDARFLGGESEIGLIEVPWLKPAPTG